MPTTYVNGINLAYQRIGSGHPVLLISGAGYGGWFWHKIAPGLGRHYNVWIPDPRGSGESSKPSGPYSVEMLAADMGDFLDRIQVRGAFVVGHALGAYVAQHLAIHRPELIGKLVIAAGNFGGTNVVPIDKDAYEQLTSEEGTPVELVRQRIAVSTAPGFVDKHPEAVEELVEYWLSDRVPSTAYQAQVSAGVAMISEEASFEEQLSQVTAPALILFGEDDRVVPPANADLLAERLPEAQVSLIGDAGHLFPLEASEATVKVLTEFFGTLKYPAEGTKN
jgi:pimeloyl-ACP methyl ester carboxylesterase